MHVYWHGLTSLRIETETRIGPVSLITDPFSSEKTGLKFPKTLTPDVVVLSHQEKKRFDLSMFENTPFLIQDPGEYEVKGIFVTGIPIEYPDKMHPHGVIYRFTIEGMTIGFLGGLERVPTDQEIELLDAIDILALPVGGGGHLTPQQAMETITRIEPRLVIPLGHALDGMTDDRGHVDQFCQIMGACKRNDASKLKIQKKDLPADELVVTVLEKV